MVKRLGKSKVKASSTQGSAIGAFKAVREQKSAADYRVVIISSDWIAQLSGRSSAEFELRYFHV